MEFEGLTDNDKRVLCARKNSACASHLFLWSAGKFGTITFVFDYNGIAEISQFFGKEYLIDYHETDDEF